MLIVKRVNIVVRFLISTSDSIAKWHILRRIYTVNLPKIGSTGITVYDNDSNVDQYQVMFLILL